MKSLVRQTAHGLHHGYRSLLLPDRLLHVPDIWRLSHQLAGFAGVVAGFMWLWVMHVAKEA